MKSVPALDEACSRTLQIAHSTLHNNPSAGFHTASFPGIFYHSAGQPIIIDSKLS